MENAMPTPAPAQAQNVPASQPEKNMEPEQKKSASKFLIIIIILLAMILAFLLGIFVTNSQKSSSDPASSPDTETEDAEDTSESDVDIDEVPEDELEATDPTADWETVNFITEVSAFSTLIYDVTYKQPADDFNQNGEGFLYHTASGADYELAFESAYESYPEAFISFEELEYVHPQFNTVFRALADEDLSVYKYSNDEQVGTGLDCDEEPFTATAPCGSPAIVFPTGAFRLSCTSATVAGLETCDLIVGTIEIEVVE